MRTSFSWVKFMVKPILAAMFALALLAGSAVGAELECQKFLAGTWTGQGDMGGTQFDNRYLFNTDGSFETRNRYHSPGAEWTEQTLAGTWTAVADPETPQGCAVTMNVVFEQDGMSGSSSSTSTFLRVDADTFSSMGYPMQRQN